jgi:starch-binding outer membrane protein, SusD/RagB family
MRQIKNIQAPAVILAMVLLLSACSKDFTTQIPSNQTSPSVALSTEGALQVALNGMYAGLRSSNLYGRTIPIVGDLMGDNIYISPINSGRYILQYTFTVIPSDGFVTGEWNDSYNAILRCNNIIDAAVPADANVNEYKGEAYATRALLYFNLVNTYAKPYTDDPSSPGVPLVLHYAPYAQPARNTVKEVFTQIVSDLKAADTLMSVQLYSNSSQFSQYAGEALLAKVYLYMGDYADAKAAAVDVINNGGFTLVPGANLIAYWNNPAIRTDFVETLFEVSSDKIDNDGSDQLAGMYDQVNGYGDMLCSTDLYNLYTSTDVRASMIIPGNKGGPVLVVNKYTNMGNPNDKDKTKVLRLSDIYLIAAETCLQTGDQPDALTYLNAIAQRGDTSSSFTGYNVSGAALQAQIIQERRKELAFEGDRFYDLNRLKDTISRSTDYQPATARTILYGDSRRVAPVPFTQIQSNPNIKQNSGY